MHKKATHQLPHKAQNGWIEPQNAQSTITTQLSWIQPPQNAQ
jgi:hypothetical protein